MTKSYKECCDEVGLDLVNISPPSQGKVWYGYQDGKAIQCNTLQEAKKFKMYETVLDKDSKQKILDYWENRQTLEVKAASIFKNELRSEYADMSDDLYNLCYTAAQDKSRSSSDYEEIPDNIKFFSDFARKAVQIQNGTYMGDNEEATEANAETA